MVITLAQPKLETTVVTASSAYQIAVTEDWVVETDDTGGDWGNSNPLFFVGDPLFPNIGDYHARSGYLQFKSFSSATQLKANLWNFTGMQYVTDFIQFNTDRFNPANPDESEKSWSFSTLQKVMYNAQVADPTGPNKLTRPVDENVFPFSDDKEPVAIKHTAEPIAGLTRNRYIPVCTYVRNEEIVPASLITEPLEGTVNTDELTIDSLTIAPRTLLVQDVKVSNPKRSLAAIGTQEYRTVTYTLAIDVEGWDIDLLQMGYYHAIDEEVCVSWATGDFELPAGACVLYETLKHKERIKIADGIDDDGRLKKPQPTSSPQLIDIEGHWINTDPSSKPLLPDGTPNPNPYDANWMDNVHYRVFRVHQHAALSGLNFT